MAVSQYRYLSSTGAGAKTGVNWANAFDWAARVATPPIDDEVCFLKGSGTYVMTASVNWTAVRVTFIGVKAATTHEGAAITFDDWERTPANFPFFDGVTYQLAFATTWKWRNISVESASANQQFYCTGAYVDLENCKFSDDHPTISASWVVYIAGGGRVVNCEITAPQANGMAIIANGSYVANDYFHNLLTCIAFNGSYWVCRSNIFCNASARGLKFYNNSSYNTVDGNSFYNCPIGIDGSGISYYFAANNNIFHTCSTDAVKFGTQNDTNTFWGNHFYNCLDDYDGVDETGPAQDYLKTVGDPLFVNPAGGDFSLQKTSPCRGTAQDQFLGVGATVKHGNKGAWQGFTNLNVLPTAGQVLRVADGGPASWGEAGEVGPGTESFSSASFSSCSDSSNSFSDSSASYSIPSISSQSSRSQSSDSQSSRSNLSGSSSSQSSRSDSSDSSSFMITAGSDSIQAQITANIKAALKTITIANGYNYDVVRVEELRKIQEMNDNLPFVLLIEGDPQKDSEDSCVIRTLNYQVWYFPDEDDRVTGDNTADNNTEITYKHRNIMADVAKALSVDPYRGIVDGTTHARAENTLVDPGYPEMYLNETLMLPGFYCDVRVMTNIDVTNPYQLRQGA